MPDETLESLRDVCSSVGGHGFVMDSLGDDEEEYEQSFVCSRQTRDPYENVFFEITSDGRFKDHCETEKRQSRPTGIDNPPQDDSFDAKREERRKIRE